VNINGTVDGCKFTNHPLQKDRMYHILNVIKKSQQNNSFKCHRLWRYVNNYNSDIAIQTAREITEYACANGCQVVVFEHLGIMKAKGSKRQKITLWRKRDIQCRVEHMCAAKGIRVAYICPKNTSALAYDGSGYVLRGDKAGFKSNKLCRFTNGKVYNCDLSASKNVAARYFLRVLQKSMPETAWSDCSAKVSELSVRTRCTLSSLIRLHAVA
jgi:IS605 OrfB family transposase